MTDVPAAGELLARRPVHEGRVISLSIDTVRFPDGTSGDLEMIRHSGAAAVVPLLDDPSNPDPRVLLVHQFRYAVGGYIYEIPAGRPDRQGGRGEHPGPRGEDLGCPRGGRGVERPDRG